MIRDAATAAAAMAAADAIGQVLADAGYLSDANLTCPGPDPLIATGRRRDLEKAARAAGDADAEAEEEVTTLVAAMPARLKTPDGIAAYRQRGRIAEVPTAASNTTRASAAPHPNKANSTRAGTRPPARGPRRADDTRTSPPPSGNNRHRPTAPGDSATAPSVVIRPHSAHR